MSLSLIQLRDCSYMANNCARLLLLYGQLQCKLTQNKMSVCLKCLDNFHDLRKQAEYHKLVESDCMTLKKNHFPQGKTREDQKVTPPKKDYLIYSMIYLRTINNMSLFV